LKEIVPELMFKFHL